MNGIQYQGDSSQNRNQQKKYKKPVVPKVFPNYLVSDSKDDRDMNKKEVNQAEPNSPFIAEDILDNTSAVPFIQRNQESFSQRREQEYVPQSSHLIEEKRRVNLGKQNKNSYSVNRSRRPFKVTEVPSLWSSGLERKKNSVDYQKIKQELYIPSEELILLEMNSV